ncbi:MAG: recombinase family protein [Pseudomonadota bacterium]
MFGAIDRAFRSTMEAMTFLDDVLTKDGIAFRSLSQHIDTRTPEGRRWYTYASAEAEYERALIARRTREAMAAQMRRGRKFGRPRILTARKLKLAKTLLRKGCAKVDTARRIGVSPRTLSRAPAVENAPS